MATRRRKTPAPPPPPDISDWARGLPDAYLLCRDLGHVWTPHSATWSRKERVFDRILRCQRCLTERRQTLNARGHPILGHYAYAKEYLAPKGAVRLGVAERDSIRLASITRTIDDELGRARARRQARKKATG